MPHVDSLRQFVSRAPGGLALFDRDMRYMAASRGWLDGFGLDVAPIGRSHDEIFREFGEACAAIQRGCLAGGTETSACEWVQAGTGETRQVRWEASPWLDPDGAIGGVLVASEDVTARVEAERRAEEFVRRHEESVRRAEAAERRLADAIEIVPGGLIVYDAQDRLVVCNQRTRDMYPAVAHVMHPGAAFDDILQVALERGHGPAEPEKAEAWLRERHERRVNPSGAIEQLTVSGRWIRIEERRLPDGGLVALRTDITDLKAREQELARKTALLEATFRDIGEGILVYGPDRGLVTGNDLAPRLLDAPKSLFEPGARLDEVLRFRAVRGDYGEVDPDEAVRIRLAQFERRTPWRSARTQPNGRTIESWVNPMPDGRMIFVLRDVTERAEAEARLEEKTRLLEATLQNMGEGIAVFGPDLKLRMWNELAAKLLDAPALARPGTAFEDVVRLRVAHGDFGDDSVDARVRLAVDLFRGGQAWSRTERRPNGVALEIRFEPLPDGGGVYVLRDVTARAESEARLAEKTALLEATLHNMGEGIAVFSPDHTLLMSNPTAAAMLAMPAELGRTGTPLAAHIRLRAERGDMGPIDPDAAVAHSLARFAEKKTWGEALAVIGGRVIDTRFSPTPDGGGIYLLRDITERAEQEAQLAEKTRLLEAALENMGEGFSVYGPDLRLTIRSRVCAAIVDLPPALAEGAVRFDEVMRFRAERGDFGEGDVAEQVAFRVKRFRAGKPWSETRRNHRGRAIETRFTPTPDGGGVFMFRDVTERADAEARLAQRNTLLEATFEHMGEGILVYDAAGRLVARNDLAPRLIRAPDALFEPGAAIGDLIRFRAQRREFGDVDPETAVREAMEGFAAGERRRDLGRQPDGRAVESRMSPMPGGGVIWLLVDVTERVEREADAARKTALLERTLESTGAGIAVFGPDLTLLTANKVVADIFLAPEVIPAPVTLEAVVRFRAARGEFGPGDVDALVQERIDNFRAQKRWTARATLEGRVIEVHFNPMPDGGGVYVLRDITERAEAEAKLAERTALLEAVLENMGEGITVIGPDLRLRVWNAAAAAMARIPASLTRAGTPWPDILRFQAARGDFGGGEAEAIVRERLAQFRNPQPWASTMTVGNNWIFDVRFNPMPDGGGIYLFREVTERVEQEARLAEKTALLEATLENMGEGITVYGPDLRLRMFNAAAIGMAGVSAALAHPGTAFADVVRFHIGDGHFPGLAEEDVLRERVALFRSEKPWTTRRSTADGRSFDIRFNPMPDGGGVYLFRDVTERAEQEARLAEKTALLEATLESIGEGIAVFGADRKLRMSNDVLARMLGMPPDLLTPGVSHDDLNRFRAARGDFDDVDVELVVRERAEVFLAGSPASVVRTMHDGRRVAAHFRPMPDGGGMYVLHDVTERERNEQRIREEEAKFRSLVEQDVAGIVIVREDGTIGYCNGCFAAMIGYTAGELDGRRLLDFVPEDEWPTVIRHLRWQFFEAGGPVQIASTLRDRAGVVIEVLVAASRSTLEGRPVSVAVVLDVTARNRAQRDLASAAAVLDAIHQSAPDGILVVDSAGRILSANRRYSEMFALPAGALEQAESGPLLDAVKGSVRDPDGFLERVRALYDQPDATAHDELAMKDGRTLDRITTPLKDADGRLLGRIWFFRDISALRATEARFRLLFEEAPDAILLLDADEMRFAAANRAAERLFGATREEICEQGARRFYAAEQPDGRPLDESIAEYNRRALAGEEVMFERRIRRLSGEERITRVTIVRLDAGSPVLRSSYVDVTEQLAAEAKLSEVLRSLVDRQEEERRRIARELHDSLGQYLAALNMRIETFNRSVPDASPLKPGLAEIKALTETIGKEVGRLAWEMRPTALDDIGLEPAFRQLLDEWAGRSGMQFDVHLDTQGRRLPAAVETTLYRVLQEGVTNIVKHAQARRVGVIVKVSAGDVVMIVEDDGVGFDQEALTRASSRLGLLGMRERLAAIEGSLEIESRPGEGTTLIIRVTLEG